MCISMGIWNKTGVHEIIATTTKIVINRQNRTKLESWELGRGQASHLSLGVGSQAPVSASISLPQS